MCKEKPSVEISNGSPSLVKIATDPRRVMHNTRRLSLVQAMSAIHQDLKIETDRGIRDLTYSIICSPMFGMTVGSFSDFGLTALDT